MSSSAKRTASPRPPRLVVDEGLDAYEAIMDGLAAGMDEVGVLFDTHDFRGTRTIELALTL